MMFFCCKCGSRLLPFETWREEEYNLAFCAYCKNKLMKFLKSKVKHIPTDEEIKKYVFEFLGETK